MYPYIIVGGFLLPSYHVMLVLGALAGFIALYFSVSGLPAAERNKLLIFAALVFIPFYAGARLGYIVESLVWHRQICGSSFFGPGSLWPGIIFAVVFSFAAAPVLKFDLLKGGDYFAPSLAIGGFFVRLGCFLRGCCFGVPCSAGNPYAAYFAISSPAYARFGETPLIPSQLFSSLSFLFIFFLLLFIRRFNPARGVLITVFCLLYSFFTFLIDFTRFYESGFHQGAVSSFLLFLISLIILINIIKRKNTKRT